MNSGLTAWRLVIHLTSGREVVTEEFFEDDLDEDEVRQEIDRRITAKDGDLKHIGNFVGYYRHILGVTVEAI